MIEACKNPDMLCAQYKFVLMFMISPLINSEKMQAHSQTNTNFDGECEYRFVSFSFAPNLVRLLGVALFQISDVVRLKTIV
jgi:hypothetical protein